MRFSAISLIGKMTELMIKVPDVIARISLLALSAAMGGWVLIVYIEWASIFGAVISALMSLLALWAACARREKMREIVGVLFSI